MPLLLPYWNDLLLMLSNEVNVYYGKWQTAYLKIP
jgi:hypothetical protein